MIFDSYPCLLFGCHLFWGNGLFLSLTTLGLRCHLFWGNAMPQRGRL